MFERLLLGISKFYAEHLPIGDRLGEMFYAVWMVVVSLGVLGSIELDQGAVLYAVLVALSVNVTWGLIDGISVMHTNVIERARAEKDIYELRTRNDAPSRRAAADILDPAITSGLSGEDRNKLLDLIAGGSPGEDPVHKRYYPGREGWLYALGILIIDTALVFPLIVPLFIWSDPMVGLYVCRLVATVLFAAIGVAYASNLHRRKTVAALFLGTLCFSVASLAYLAGW